MYVKLGEKAESFSDPISGFNIAGNEVKELTAAQKNSLKTRRAITGGQLAHASKDELKEYEELKAKADKKLALSQKVESSSSDSKEFKKQIDVLEEEISDKDEEIRTLKEKITTLEDTKPGEIDYEEKTKPELVDFYQNSYEVSEDDVKNFSKLSKEEMIEELKDLEEV